MNSRPLVYQITNTVSAQLQADCTALLGGLSVMSRCGAEAAEVAAASDALLINIGTPPDSAKELYHAAAGAAERAGIPIILDIVGCGFTSLRTEIANELLASHRFSVVKGNYSEIAALSGQDVSPRGVSDACGTAPVDMRPIVMDCAKRYNCTVFATGSRDHLADGAMYESITGGAEATQYLSGIGCALGSAAALFCTWMTPYEASLTALRLFRQAAEEAAALSVGRYSFKIKFLDSLARLGKTVKECHAL